MREIKFRAWDAQHNKMVTDFEAFLIVPGAVYKMEQHGPDAKGWPMESLMQYTGLKDKNGKEIYEGDILEGGNFSAVVAWDNHYAMWRGVTKKEESFSMRALHFTPVIGNIYENPELLK